VSKLLLTESQRERLKEPLGQLVAGTSSECNQKLKDMQAAEKPSLLILVGDTISRNAIQSGIKPSVIIIDNKEMRGDAAEFSHGKLRAFRTVNEPSTINFLAWQAVAEAIESGDSVVLVDGEEDLLTLVAILVAPSGSVVAYGQPEIGIVLVRISDAKKNEIQALVDQMIKVE
jgi:uncharacterized protein (UPF0218 family)